MYVSGPTESNLHLVFSQSAAYFIIKLPRNADSIIPTPQEALISFLLRPRYAILVAE